MYKKTSSEQQRAENQRKSKEQQESTGSLKNQAAVAQRAFANVGEFELCLPYG